VQWFQVYDTPSKVIECAIASGVTDGENFLTKISDSNLHHWGLRNKVLISNIMAGFRKICDLDAGLLKQVSRTIKDTSPSKNISKTLDKSMNQILQISSHDLKDFREQAEYSVGYLNTELVNATITDDHGSCRVYVPKSGEYFIKVSSAYNREYYSNIIRVDSHCNILFSVMMQPKLHRVSIVITTNDLSQHPIDYYEEKVERSFLTAVTNLQSRKRYICSAFFSNHLYKSTVQCFIGELFLPEGSYFSDVNGEIFYVKSSSGAPNLSMLYYPAEAAYKCHRRLRNMAIVRLKRALYRRRKLKKEVEGMKAMSARSRLHRFCEYYREKVRIRKITRLQAFVRKRIARQNYLQILLRNHSAGLIQRLWRGFIIRKMVGDVLEKRREEMWSQFMGEANEDTLTTYSSSTRRRSSFSRRFNIVESSPEPRRSRKPPMKFADVLKAKRNFAAIMIQNFQRSYIAKQKLKLLQLEKQSQILNEKRNQNFRYKSALKLQTQYRRYYAYKKFQVDLKYHRSSVLLALFVKNYVRLKLKKWKEKRETERRLLLETIQMKNEEIFMRNFLIADAEAKLKKREMERKRVQMKVLQYEQKKAAEIEAKRKAAVCIQSLWRGYCYRDKRFRAVRAVTILQVNCGRILKFTTCVTSI
jgi:hypothetical protein